MNRITLPAIELSALPEHPARTATIRSMRAVEAGDREGWLACFAADAIVEDPVGPSVFDESGDGHRGIEAIAAFWDSAITGAAKIEFLIERSHAGGDRCANVGRIRNTMPDGSVVTVTGAFVYRVDADGQVVHLQAFWQMDQINFAAAPE